MRALTPDKKINLVVIYTKFQVCVIEIIPYQVGRNGGGRGSQLKYCTWCKNCFVQPRAFRSLHPIALPAFQPPHNNLIPFTYSSASVCVVSCRVVSCPSIVVPSPILLPKSKHSPAGFRLQAILLLFRRSHSNELKIYKVQFAFHECVIISSEHNETGPRKKLFFPCDICSSLSGALSHCTRNPTILQSDYSTVDSLPLKIKRAKVSRFNALSPPPPLTLPTHNTEWTNILYIHIHIYHQILMS